MVTRCGDAVLLERIEVTVKARSSYGYRRAYLNDVSSAAVVMAQLPDWFADYNEHHPHKGLNMLSPRQFRRLQCA